MEPTEVGTRLFFTHPERDKRDTARSAAVSSLFHFLIVILFILLSRAGMHVLSANDQGVGTGVGAGAAGGGGGGGSEEQVSVLIPEPPPEAPEDPQVTVPEKMVPLPTVPVPELEIPKLDSLPQPPVVPSPSPSTSTSTSGAGGGGTGPGTGPGVGPGSGGGTGGGEGGGIGSGVGPGTGKGRVIAPSPEILLVPPPGPGRVRGKVVTVRMAVDTAGVVKSAEIIPSTGDRKYDDTLKRTALGWRFRPARDATNRPVSVVFDVQLTIGQ
jgi:periplasmic protein TonB